MGFFEWEDTGFSIRLVQLISVLTLALALFLSANASAVDTNLYIYLVISSLIALVATITMKDQINAFGSKTATYTFLIGGLIFGGFLGLVSTGGLNLVLPTQAIFLGDLRFIFANLIAPVIEPVFWRGIVFPLALIGFLKLIGKKNYPVAVIFALLLAGFTFGMYHISAYFQQTGDFLQAKDMISLASMFGIVFILTNSLAKTIAFETGWHFMNNLFSEGYELMNIIPTAIIFLVGFAVLIEIADRMGR